MRVLTVTNMYPTATEPWFGSFVKDQTDALRRLGVSIDVLRFDGRRSWRAYASAARAVQRRVALGTYDLVHAHYGLTGAVALCQRSLPVVTTFHGSDSGQIAWQRRVSWVVARRSTPIFVAAENARALGLADAPVVPAGVDTTLFRPTDRADARAVLGWPQNHTYVLLPGGRTNRVKRADLFDEVLNLVARTIPDVRGVSLEGYSRQAVATVMNAVDVLLLTSDSEGSPVAVKEALACLTPVVSVPVGDVPAVLAGLPGCAIAPRDAKLLADAVVEARTVRDPALRGRAEEFSYDRVAARILEIYERAQAQVRRSRLPARSQRDVQARPRRLCMIVHGPYPVGEPRVAREAAAAQEDGYEVDVVAMRRMGEPSYEVVDGVVVRRLPVHHERGTAIGRVVVEYLVFTALAAVAVGTSSVRRRYDIVHVHSPPDFLIVAALLPRVLGSRVILDVHDPSPEMFAMRFPGRAGAAAAAILRRLERLATQFADAVVTVHQACLRELVARGTPPEKTTVVMNSLDERLLPSSKRRIPETFRVVYHGTVAPHYGVHLLVDAIAETIRDGLDLRGEIIGEGDSVPELWERVATLNLSDRIRIDGRHLPHRTVLERVNGASAGVIPNLPTPLNRFALSSKLFEYVVLGVPVISAALPTIREHFDDSEVLFFRPGDASSLAAALAATAADPDAAARRAAKARLRYEAYSWTVNSSRYRSLLAGLSAHRPADDSRGRPRR